MVRLIAVLLLGLLASVITIRALGRGEVRATFSLRNVRRLKDDSTAFWIFTCLWGAAALGGLAGAALLLYYGVSRSGPFASGNFLTLQPREWPLVIMIIGCIFLLVEHVQIFHLGRRSDGGPSNAMRSRAVALALVGWLAVAGIAGLTLLPHLPSTWAQWLALVVLGPPVYVALEALGAWLFSPTHGEAISAKPFSLRRIGLVVILVALAAAMVGAIHAIW